MDEVDVKLARICGQIAANADLAADWVNRNKDGVGPKSNSLRKEIRRQAELARTFEHAAEQPLAIGIFGPSQTGKSYLVSALARKEDHPLIAMLDKERHFLKEIGPEKNQEATGLVTRFSIHPTGGTATHPVA